MIRLIRNLFVFLLPKFQLTTYLMMENIVLRHQLTVLQRTAKKPQLKKQDKLFWIIIYRLWKSWKESLVIVKPETVIRWHKEGFRLFWKLKSRNVTPGRKRISSEIRKLVLTMANMNINWGAPKIHGELIRLGIKISERTISNIIRHRTKPPSQTWKTFLKNHMDCSAAIDFFTVQTATFKILYVLVVLAHDRRKVLHFNATYHPTAEWSRRQIVEAFPWDTAPKYLFRDRGSSFGSNAFRNQVKNLGITEVISAYRSPWQNPYVERFIGSIRRECLDHMIIFSRSHLKRRLSEYFEYYNNDRTHYSLEKDAPIERPVEPKPNKDSKVIAIPRLNGLHHRYEWKKAA